MPLPYHYEIDWTKVSDLTSVIAILQCLNICFHGDDPRVSGLQQYLVRVSDPSGERTYDANLVADVEARVTAATTTATLSPTIVSS